MATRSKSFPQSYWDPKWRAHLFLNEFALTGWQSTIVIPPWDDAKTPGELDELRRMKDEERDKWMDEIRAQNDDMFNPLGRLLLMNPVSHPATFQLAHVAILVGRPVIMHFKNLHNRPRPTQYAPELEPPIDVPGHPSYPGGHVTQVHLIALILGQLLPDREKALKDFAWRVGVNRERVGFHYRSDTEAGVALGAAILPLLATGQEYRNTFAAAQREWIDAPCES